MRVDLPELEAYILCCSLDSGEKPGSLLHLACILGDCSLVQRLVQAGMSIEFEAAAVGTPLHCACAAARVDVVRALLALPSSHNLARRPVMSYGSESPLQLAVASNAGWRSIEVCRLLIDARASLEDRDGTGYRHTALMRAISRDAVDVAQWLVETYPSADHGTHTELLFSSLRSPSIIRLIFDKFGIDINIQKHGWSVVMSLVMSRNTPSRLEALRTVLELRADPSTPNSSGETPLQKEQQQANPDSAVLELLMGGGQRQVLQASHDASRSTSPLTPPAPELSELHFGELLEMGFHRDRVTQVLPLAHGDLQAAVHMLLGSHPHTAEG
jgi:ankyrin repeat protein